MPDALSRGCASWRRGLERQPFDILRRRAFGAALAVGVALALAVAGQPARAQQDDRPSTLPLPTPRPSDRRPDALELPPIPAPAAPSAEERLLSQSLAIRVEGFDFAGHSAFTTERLRGELASFTGRELDSEQLLAARDRVTRLYLENGYVTSGALLPDQSVASGRVLIRIVEGRLDEIDVSGTRRFAARYLRGQMRVAGRAPVDVGRLELALQQLQQDPLIAQVTARLEPMGELGRSRLVLAIVEARQEDLRIGAANDRSPSVGEETGLFSARVANLVGVRDELGLSGWLTEGLRDLEATVGAPITARGTRVEARVRYSESRIVEFPFDPLDIESESLTVSLGLYQTVYRSREHSVEIGLRGDWRRGRSTLDGRLFCFQPGVVDCTPAITALRLVGDWRWQVADQAIAARSLLSWGNGWLGATTRPGNVPDGRFVSWLLQAQYARRLPLDSRLVTRFDLQLTDDPLLGFERIAVGGARTVRGYRPNQLVRDSGVNGSLEWRVPVWKRPLGDAYLELAPFFDVGHAWNERFDAGDNTIASLGLGLLARPHERVEAEVYWGGRLLGVDRIGSGLIGDGLHLRVAIDVW